MRVGVIGPQGPDDFADNISDSLTAMGIDNVRLGPTQPRVLAGRLASALTLARKSAPFDELVQRRISRLALEAECTFVLTVDGMTSPTVIRELRANGVSVALWFPDAITNFGRGQMLMAPYSGLFFKEPRLVERVQATLGLPIHYLPEACNPHWHRSSEPQGVDPVVVVAGNMYPSRLVLLEKLLAAGIPLALYGGGYPRWITAHPTAEFHTGRYIVRTEKADVFRRAAAVLNNLHPAEIDGVNCRLFEATGSGAVVLAESRSTIPDLFAPDELVQWSGFDQLVDEARHAVSAAGSMAHIGDRAAARAHAEHTYAKRLRVIFEKSA